MTTVRVIKKYPNRRLYDTEDSRYITLSDIRDLVLGEVEFIVVDKKNGHDITRCVLMQVISEQEQNGDPVMSQAFLSEIIRHHDVLTSAPLSTYLEQSLSKFVGVEGTQRRIARWKSPQNEGRPRITGDTGDVGEQIAPERKKAS